MAKTIGAPDVPAPLAAATTEGPVTKMPAPAAPAEPETQPA
jgi:hypothetical protein